MYPALFMKTLFRGRRCGFRRYWMEILAGVGSRSLNSPDDHLSVYI